MKVASFLFTFSFLLVSNYAFAVNVTNCRDEGGVILNNVVEMKMYANGSVKVFSIDQIEPAAAAFGVAIAIDRGDDLSNLESFCRFVSGMSYVDLKNIKSSYDTGKGLLSLVLPVRSMDSDGGFSGKTLRLVINKGAKTEQGLVSASIK